MHAPLHLLSKATGSRPCHPRATVITYRFPKRKGKMFPILSITFHRPPPPPLKTCSVLKTKPFSTGKHGSTELEVAAATQTVPVTPGIHLTPPHQTTPHVPRMEGLFNPSHLCSSSSVNQRCPARPLATSRHHHWPSSFWQVGSRE